MRATVCVLRGASQLGEELRAEGLPFRFFGDHAYDPTSGWKLWRLIRERRIDLLHVTDFGASTFGRLAGRLARTPTIVHVRSHHSEHQPRGFPLHVEYAYRALAPHTDRAIAISESVRRFAIRRMGFRPGQVEILNNPLARFSFAEPEPERVPEIRRRHGIEPDAPVIGAVTRFHAAKGIRYLVEAFARVLDAVPEARLVLVGEGPEESRLRALARELGVMDRIVFAGFRRDVQAYYRLFRVSAVPSIEEGFGNVALEAMAMGTPVVASREGGLPEIVREEETGILVPTADAGALARALLRLLRDPGLRDRMGAAARARSEEFSMDRYVERLLEIYRDVVAGGAGRRAAAGTRGAP